MLSHAVHEFAEAGIVPGIVQPLWDTGAALPDKSGAGRFLASLFGYSSDPSLSEVAAWSLYLLGALAGYFWPHSKAKAVRA